MHKDFITNETVKFETEAGQWEYKPVTGGEENDWIEEYIVEKPILDPETGEVIRIELKEDRGKLNWCRLRNLVSVPYKPEQIYEILGWGVKEGTEPKEWKDLDWKDRQEVLRKLHPQVFSEVLNKSIKANRPREDDIKKSS